MLIHIKKIIPITIFLSLYNVLSFAGEQRCHTPQSASACATLSAYEPKNLRTLKQEIIQYHDSGMWEKTRECLAQQAQEILQKYIPVKNKKLAVIFDIDDTSLSSWDFNLKEDFGYNFERYSAWEIASNMPPIKPILQLYRFAQNHGFAVFFITGRRENQRATTEHNLVKAGFTNWNGLFLKPLDYNGRHAAGPKSTWRKKIQDQGYTIVLSVGDQETDFIGSPHALYNLKLPNPMYIVP